MTKFKAQNKKPKRLIIRTSFNLIEVAVATTILVLIAGGMLEVFRQGFNIGEVSKKRTVAYSLDREVMEEYFDWNRLDRLDGNIDGIIDTPRTYINPRATDPVNISGVIYTPNITILDGPVLPAELKRVDVTISWETENYTITTLKANY